MCGRGNGVVARCMEVVLRTCRGCADGVQRVHRGSAEGYRMVARCVEVDME